MGLENLEFSEDLEFSVNLRGGTVIKTHKEIEYLDITINIDPNQSFDVDINSDLSGTINVGPETGTVYPIGPGPHICVVTTGKNLSETFASAVSGFSLGYDTCPVRSNETSLQHSFPGVA